MRMPRAKSGYQRAELSKSWLFPPPRSAVLRGCLRCRSLAGDPGVLAPARLPSPIVLAGGDIPSTVTPRSGDPGPGWETHPAIMYCCGTPRLWWSGCTQHGTDAWTVGSSLHQPQARAAQGAKMNGASCPPCFSPMQGPAQVHTSASTAGDTYSSPWLLGPRRRVWLCMG